VGNARNTRARAESPAGAPGSDTVEEMSRRLLIVATAPDPSDELLDQLERDARDDLEVAVVAPASDVSLFQWLAGDDERAREAAERRAMEAAEVEALAARVTNVVVGDPDPVAAVEDALKRFPADELVLVTRPKDRATWLEKRAVSGELEQFGLPVTYLVDDDAVEAADNVVPFARPGVLARLFERKAAAVACAETIESILAATDERTVATVLFDDRGCPTSDPSTAVRGEVVEVERGGIVVQVFEGLGWRIDPLSAEGGLATPATRPRRRGETPWR
jgi:hypothetical protein